MASVGAYLRDLRVKRGLSLEDVTRVTRIAPRYLEALENDSFDSLPAPVFARGFIRAYSQAVGGSPEEALAIYDGRDGVPQPPAAAVPHRAMVSPPAHAGPDADPKGRSAILVSFVLLVVLGVALFAVALVTQPAREQRAERLAPPAAAPPPAAPPVGAITAAADAPPRPAPAPVSKPAPRPPEAKVAEPVRPVPPPRPPEAKAPEPTSTTNFGATPAAPLPPVAPLAPTGPRPWLSQVQSATSGVSTPYRLVARVSEPTWIRVRTEDGRTTEETVPAGGVREWVSNRPFVITIGNAGGVSFELNGRSLPSFGASGTVISGVVLPPEGARSQ
jgi:cytoskeleton protein RodZ